MSNYGDMQSRIADEIKRSNLTSQIQNAIQTAIQAYEARPFWFNMQRATMNTVSGTKIYGLPSVPATPAGAPGIFKKMRMIRLSRDNGATWQGELTEYTRDEAMAYDTVQTLGVPDHYFIDYLEKPTIADDHATLGQLWLLPIPNSSTYLLELQYLRELNRLSANGDENAWTNEGELLIRCRAKRELYTHVIRDTDEAIKMATAERDALSDIIRRGVMARAPGRIKANW